VESEIKHYDGALRWTQWPKRILMTSYSDAGNEVILSWSYPDNPLDTAYIKMLILTEEGSKTLKRRFNRIVRSYYTWKYDLKEPASSSPEAFAYLTDPDEPFYLERQASLLSSGCHDVRSGRAKVVGQDVALNYATTVVQLHQNEDRPQWHTRITIWMAPELSCAVLRATVETHQAGGWRVVTERKALRVSVNRSN
jgi:hypothetical protein